MWTATEPQSDLATCRQLLDMHVVAETRHEDPAEDAHAVKRIRYTCSLR